MSINDQLEVVDVTACGDPEDGGGSSAPPAGRSDGCVWTGPAETISQVPAAAPTIKTRRTRL